MREKTAVGYRLGQYYTFDHDARDAGAVEVVVRAVGDAWIDKDRLELPVILDLQRMSDGKNQIRDAFISLQHRDENTVEIGCSHAGDRYSSQSSAGGVLRKARNFFLSIALS